MTARTLGERYELIDLIARGGMGSVYAARDVRLHRDVAVKLLKEELSEDPRFIERFKREARSAASLSHANVARIFDYGVDEDHHFIVMELAEGTDLAHLLREEGALPPDRARSIGAQVAAALGHAHDVGLIHRDVKPANVMVGEKDRVKVTDFGIARAAGESTLTATGSVLGTAQYLAPEQATGDAVTAATDVYAVGILLYEMLTGTIPFTGGSAVEVAMRHVKDDVPVPSDLDPAIPAHLDRVVARATQKDPARRYADGNELAEDLGRDVAGATAPIAAPGRTAVLPVAPRRWNTRTLGHALLLLFGALVVVATVLAAMRIATGPGEEPADRPAVQDDAPAQDGEEPEAAVEGYVVPDVIGMEFKDAEERIKQEMEAAGLDIKVEKEDVETPEPKDTVVDSNPEPGSEVPSGGTITLYVSRGEVSDDDDEGPGQGRGKGRGRGNNKEGDDD